MGRGIVGVGIPSIQHLELKGREGRFVDFHGVAVRVTKYVSGDVDEDLGHGGRSVQRTLEVRESGILDRLAAFTAPRFSRPINVRMASAK